MFAGGRVIEADFCPWSTGGPLPRDWVASIADLPTLEILVLRDTDAREQDILRAVEMLPVLAELVVPEDALSAAAREELGRRRPSLDLR